MLSRRQFLGGAVLLVPLVRRAHAGVGSCAPTVPNELGPFYRAHAPARTTLCDAADAGEPFALAGRVVSADGCTPLAGALVEVWHADAAGIYDMLAPGQPRDPAVYHLRAVLRTAADGGYAFDTITPGAYSTRARHIHFLVHADGHEPLIVQSYFAGDPRLAGDNIARPANAIATVPAEVRGRRGRRGRFDLALRRHRPAPPDARASFAAYEGDYRFPDGLVVHIARAGDGLFIDVPGYGRIEALFDARDRFRVLEFDSTATPERGPDGRIAALVVRKFGERAPIRVTRVR